MALLTLGACRRADVDALMSLYELTDGHSWRKNTNWAQDADPCAMNKRWAGVGTIDPCDRWRDGEDCFFGRVTSIALDYNGLRGSLANWTQVANLTRLTFLDLSWNGVSGWLPTEIGQLNSLHSLLAPHNSLSGSIPTEIGAINSHPGPDNAPAPASPLEELALAHNLLSGSLPAALATQHPGLTSIDVRNNRLSGGLASEFGALPSLATLHAADNTQLGGWLPAQMGGLSALRHLDLSRTGLSGTVPPSTGRIGLLHALSLEANMLSGSLPDTLTDLLGLRTLRLASNSFTGTLPDSLGNLRNLEVLDVYDNALSGDVPSSVRELGELKEMYLSNEHLLPLRRRFCGQRLPNLGKYSWRLVRDEYDQMMATHCPADEMHDTDFTFSSLQDSGVYPL